jgi:predicted metal-dependent peptidase
MVKEQKFKNLKGLIYFTDGYGIFPVKMPVYDVAFVFMQENYNDLDVPPWAIKIILSPEEIGEEVKETKW